MPFPITPVFETFSKPAENPIGAPWQSLANTPDCQITDGQFAATGAFGQAYYTPFTGIDVELYGTCAVRSGVMFLGFRMRDATDDLTKFGYHLFGNGTTIALQRHPPGGPDVTIHSTGQPVSSGDGIGVRAAGPFFWVYYRPGLFGAWQEIASAVTDTTYSGGGVLLLQCSDTSGRWDLIGGGNYADQEGQIANIVYGWGAA